MPPSAPPALGTRFENLLHFRGACDSHAFSAEPPFTLTPRKLVEAPAENALIVYACSQPGCTFAISAGVRGKLHGGYIVFAASYAHSCGLPSPFAIEPPGSPVEMRTTPAGSPPQPSWKTSPALGSAPSTSALASHWSWLSFGKEGQQPPAGAQSPPRVTFPSFKKESKPPSVEVQLAPMEGLQPATASRPPRIISSPTPESDIEVVEKPAATTAHPPSDTLSVPPRSASREPSSEPEWPPTDVKMRIPYPKIGEFFPSRDAGRAALDRAGAAAEPPFTVYTARSTNTPPEKAFIIWHCQHRARNGDGCSFYMRMLSKDSTLTKWQIMQANYDHSNHPPPGWKASRKKPSNILVAVRDHTPGAETSDASDAPLRGRRGNRAAPKERPTPEYVPNPNKKRRILGGVGDGPGGYTPPVIPQVVGPLGPFLAGLHPMLGECGPLLEEAGVSHVQILLDLEDKELREVLKNVVNFKPFHRAVIAHRVAQVKEGKRDNPLDWPGGSEMEVKVEEGAKMEEETTNNTVTT